MTDTCARARRHLFGEELHALAREVEWHVAEMELHQQIADGRRFKNCDDALVNGVGRSDDDRLRALQIVPVLGVAEQRRRRIGGREKIAPFLRGYIGHARPVGELAPLAALVALEAVAQEVPDALARQFARLGVGLANHDRHEDAHAVRLVFLAVFGERLLEQLLGFGGRK